MSAIQIVLLAASGFAASRAYVRFRRGGMPFAHLVGWTLLWIAVVVVAIRPETASALARIFGVGRGADLVVYLALVAAFYMIFRLLAKTDDLERQITKVVRTLALKDLDETHERRS